VFFWLTRWTRDHVIVRRPSNFEESDQGSNPRPLVLVKLTWIQHSNYSATKFHRWARSKKPIQSCFPGQPAGYVFTWLSWGLVILRSLTSDRTDDLLLPWRWLETNTLTTRPRSSTDELRKKGLVNPVYLVNSLDTWPRYCSESWLFWGVRPGIVSTTFRFGVVDLNLTI